MLLLEPRFYSWCVGHPIFRVHRLVSTDEATEVFYTWPSISVLGSIVIIVSMYSQSMFSPYFGFGFGTFIYHPSLSFHGYIPMNRHICNSSMWYGWGALHTIKINLRGTMVDLVGGVLGWGHVFFSLTDCGLCVCSFLGMG